MRPLTALLAGMTLAATLTACGNEPTADDPDLAAESSTESAESPEPTQDEPTDDVKVSKALQFKGTTIDGASFDGASLAGKPAVLWFWAPWCPTCRAQIPNLTELGQTYKGEVEIVGVGGLDSADSIKKTAGDIENLTHLVDEEGGIWQHFQMTEQSTYVLIDANGKIVESGSLDDAELNELVADLV